MVNPSDIELITDREIDSSRANRLRGTVTSMALERATGSALISVQAGDIILKSRMPVEKIKEVQISPASEVILSFSPEDVRWI